MNEFYQELNRKLESIIPEHGPEEAEWIADLANAAALLWEYLPEINWAGVYLWNQGRLLLGPFQGRIACREIAIGRGVCGTAFEKRETLVVPDVHEFPGHIACDERSRSEIVIPLFRNGEVAGVLDIDSPVPGRFTEEDKTGLEVFGGILNS